MEKNTLYYFGPFCLDSVECVLLREGRLVPLAPKAISTLLVLVRRCGHLVEKDTLMSEVWPSEVVEEGNLAQHIFHLRKALNGNGNDHQHIETVPRRGYRFVGAVTEIVNDRHQLAMLPLQYLKNHSETISHLRSLAILPFSNTTRDQAIEPFSEGITEALINSLSRVPQLRVTARSTVNRYKNNDRSYADIGRELGVQWVFGGRVRLLEDNRLIVETELVDVATTCQVWGESFNTEVMSLLDIQDQIVTRITQVLHLTFEADKKQELTKRHTGNSEAHQSYLKGRFYWNKRSKLALKKSIDYFESAIQSDPDYALSYAGLADAYNILGFYSFIDSSTAFSRAKAAATKALTIDQTLAEGHASLGFARLLGDWDSSVAELCFKRSIQLNPNYLTAYLFYGCQLTAEGRFDEAVAMYKRALEIDPLSLIANASLGYGYYFARRYQDAISQCTVAIEMDDQFEVAHYWLGCAYQQIGMLSDAQREYETALSLSNDRTPIIAALANLLALSGKAEDAKKEIEKLRERSKQEHVSFYDLACIYVCLGDIDQGFHWLERACERRSHLMINLDVDPRLDPLRSDPRFAPLLARITNTEGSQQPGNAKRGYVDGCVSWLDHTNEGIERAADCFQEFMNLESADTMLYAGAVDCYLRLATSYFLPPIFHAQKIVPLTVDDLKIISPDRQAFLKVREELDLATLRKEKQRASELGTTFPGIHQWNAAYHFFRSVYYERLKESQSKANAGSQEPIPVPTQNTAEQFCLRGLKPDDEVQILCVIARQQIEAGNIQGACLVLQSWYTVGKWPRLHSLSPHMAANLLLTAGELTGRVASSKQLSRGQKHSEVLLSGAISIFEQLGQKNLVAVAKSELGRCYDREGMFELACKTFAAALETLLDEHGNLRSTILTRMAFAEMKAGRLRDSLTRLNDAWRNVIFADPAVNAHLHTVMAITLGELAIDQKKKKYFNEAHQHYQHGMFFAHGTGHHYRVVALENNRGHLLQAFGQLVEAEPHLRRARNLVAHLGDHAYCAQLDETLARFHLRKAELELAEGAIAESVVALERGEEEALLSESLRTQGQILCKRGRHKEAKRVLERAYQISERCGDYNGAGLALLTMVEEVPDQLDQEELRMLAITVHQLLGQSQTPSVAARIDRCVRLSRKFDLPGRAKR